MMLGYSKGEWIFAGVLFAVLMLWLFVIRDAPEPKKPKPERASTAEIMECGERIKRSATNPSTVVLHQLAGTSSDKKGPGGTSRVKMAFEAKNAFGLEQEFEAVCQFAAGVPEIQIFNR